ncbi:MAG TPA: fibronectin type III domain-containing protein, partial [Vicingaceae bacterium]
DPMFANPASGQFAPTNAAVDGIADASVNVTVDFYGVTRAVTPDPGAIEFMPPTCPQPSNLAVTNVTGTTVDLSWTENGTATIWDIEWDTAGFTPTGIPTITGTTTNPHPLTGLTPLTDYEFYVRAYCSASDTSLWSGPYMFSTLCATQLSGAYTIGTAGNYLTFTDAVNDMVTCGISGPVVFNVLTGSGPFNEQITIPPIIGASGVNTITFNGNGEVITSTTSTSARSIILLDGADHVTFDSLTVQTQSSTNNFAIQLINNADSNTINNCVVDLTSALTSTSSTNAGIVVSGSLTSATTAGASGAYNTITNNHIIGGYYGVTINGASSTSESMNNVVDSNRIEDFYFYGTYLRSISNSSISFNDISRPNRTSVSTFYGLYFITSGEGNMIEGNRLHDPFRGLGGVSTSAAYPVYYSSVDATVGNENRVVNNLIYNINSNGTIYALYNIGSDGVHYYHNTISLDDQNSTGGTTRGFYQTTTASNIEFVNNIVTVTRSGGGALYCLYFNATGSAIVSDNNVLYTPTTINNTGYFGGNQNTLVDWQTATTGDANSVDAQPLYVNSTANDFTPSSPLVDGIADPSVNVLTDIFGVTRAVTPDPGAIEFTPPSCPQPSNLTAINVTGSSADLSWLETGSATTWQIDWDTAGVAQGFGNIVVTTNNPHTISVLSPESEYRYYVRSICAVGDTSLWGGPYTLTTLCAPSTAPWIDSVETHLTTTSSMIENCWSSSPSNTTSSYRWNIDGAGSTPSSSTGPSGAYSGNNYFYTEASNGSAGDVAELYTPMIDVSALTLPELSFYYHMYGQTMGDLYIDVFDGVNWVTTDSIKGEQQTADTDPWLQHKIVLNNFPDTIQVRFRSIRSTNFYGDMSLDDIEIKEAPTCPQPIALNVSNLTMNSAAFGWTEVGSATNWQIEWGISGFTLGGGVRLMTTTNPHTQLGLQAAVSYDFYVRSVCTPGDSSLWTGPYTFTTPICNPSQQCNYTFRMTDSFGDGWNGNTMDIIQNGITVATIGGTFTTGNGPVDITVPLCSTFPFDLFWNTGGSFATEVGIEIIDANNTSIFTHNPGTDLSGSTLYTDSVFCPTCPSASNLTDSAVSATSVDLSWTVNSTATSWEIEWDTTGFIQGTGNIAITSNNPYNVSGLTPGGFYQFYVRDICAIGDTSNWSGPHTFTAPLCDLAYQCSYIFRMTDSFGDGWNGNTMDIIQGGVVVATIELTTGSGPVDVAVPLCDTIPFDLFWNTGGSWNTEVGVQILDASNNVVFTHASGTDLSGTTIFTGTVDCPCADPSNLAANNVTYTTADLAWTENGSATVWNVEWGAAGFTLGTGTLIASTTNNPEAITGLTAATAYEFYVQSDCSQDSSTWVGPYMFVTPCVLDLGLDTIVCSTDSLLLDAGNGFSTYAWSTGDSTQTILIDTNTLGGNGVYTIYVDVTDTVSGCTGTDTIIVEFTNCVGIGENSPNIDMIVYPNPSKGQFTINLTTTNTTDLQIRITNIQGQEVFVKNNFDNINIINEEINIGNVKGVYFVNIITNNEVITKKIIVQ